MGDYRGDLLFSARLTRSIGWAQANKMWELRVYLGGVGEPTPRNPSVSCRTYEQNVQIINRDCQHLNCEARFAGNKTRFNECSHAEEIVGDDEGAVGKAKGLGLTRLSFSHRC